MYAVENVKGKHSMKKLFFSVILQKCLVSKSCSFRQNISSK